MPRFRPMRAARLHCILLVALLLGCITSTLRANELPDSLLSLSLEDLMEVEVYTGSITGTQRIDAPVAHTVITREMIRTTPARNLLDLIEIYVPGATYVDHYMGPRIGFRGILGDQNYSFLLLVNGRNMNLRMLQGPQYELENRELNDIEEIEIIRGPGSVTYGPGAIGGVINIKTRTAASIQPGVRVRTQQNLGYRYTNVFVEYQSEKAPLQVHANASYSRSRGIEDPDFYYVCWGENCGYGYMDVDWGENDRGSAAPNTLEDFDAQPQLKLNLDFQHEKLFGWLRYTSFSHTKQIQETVFADGPGFTGIQGQSLALTAGHSANPGQHLELRNTLSFDSKSYRDVAGVFRLDYPHDHILQRSASFSENSLFFQSLFSSQRHRRIKYSLGVEAEYQWYGPEWGEDDNTFLYRFQSPLGYTVLEESSQFYQRLHDSTTITVAEERIDGYQTAAFGEVNVRLSKKLVALISARADKHEFSDPAFSPRIALMAQLSEHDHLRLVAQNSVRLPLFANLYSQDRISDQPAETERIAGLEASYTRFIRDRIQVNATSYYNKVAQVSWLGTTQAAGRVGTFENAGVELEGIYSVPQLYFGLNYSYIHQLSWSPTANTEAYLSGMGADSLDVFLPDFAESRMNNLPGHALKFFSNYNLSKHFSLHLNGRCFWDYGQSEMLDKFMDAHRSSGTAEQQAWMQAIYDELRDEGYTRPSFTSNLQLSYANTHAHVDYSLALYAMNVFSVNHVRYIIQYWESGNLRQYPRQCGFIKEPLSLGLCLSLKF